MRTANSSTNQAIGASDTQRVVRHCGSGGMMAPRREVLLRGAADLQLPCRLCATARLRSVIASLQTMYGEDRGGWRARNGGVKSKQVWLVRRRVERRARGRNRGRRGCTGRLEGGRTDGLSRCGGFCRTARQVNGREKGAADARLHAGMRGCRQRVRRQCNRAQRQRRHR